LQNASSSTRNRQIAASASLGALAVILSQVSLPLTLFGFLRFDLAEVIDVLSFLLLGPTWGLLTLLIHWFGLNVFPSGIPIVGPFMKLLAVLSMFLGFWITGKIWKLLVGKKGGGKIFLGLLLVNGALLRVGIMGLANFLLFMFLLPESYLPFLTGIVGQLGFDVSSDIQVAWISIGLISIFNAIHVPFSVIPAYILLKRILKTPAGRIANSWENRLGLDS